MAKVIVERPRQGGRGTKYPRGSAPGRGRVAMEEWHRREGIRRAWRHDRKMLNENLAPLRRYLRSQVGRPWDDVYSEVCARINRNSAVQLHIWQHLVEYVCTNPYEVSGDINRGSWSWRRFAFYVDPQTGALRENERHGRRNWWSGLPEREEPGARDRVAVDATHECRRIGGIWYELTLEPVPPGAERVPDVCLQKDRPTAPVAAVWSFHRRSVYAVKKRQLNSREIQRLRPTDE